MAVTVVDQFMQVLDKPDLLDIMMRDSRRAPDIYRPTNYWEVYEKRFLPELRELGLKDFRRRRRSVLSSFGATDLQPLFGRIDLTKSSVFGSRFARRLPGWRWMLEQLGSVLNRQSVLPIKWDLYDCTVKDLRESAYRLARLLGERANAKSIDELETSLIGNPEDVFEIDGRAYTMR